MRIPQRLGLDRTTSVRISHVFLCRRRDECLEDFLDRVDMVAQENEERGRAVVSIAAMSGSDVVIFLRQDGG